MRELFRDQLEQIHFIHLKEDLVGKGEVKLLKQFPLPLLEGEEVNLRNILEGIVFLYGVHHKWGNREYYESVLKAIDEEVGGVSLLPLRYVQEDKKKSLILCLGLIQLHRADETTLITGAESALELSKNHEEESYQKLALELLHQGIELYGSWNFHYHLAYLHYSRKKYNQAFEEFSKAYHLCDKEEFRQEIGEMISFSQRKKDYEDALILLEKGRALEASILLESLREEFSDWPDLFYYLGISYRLQGDHRKAIECFRQGVALEFSERMIYQLSMTYLLEEEPYESFALLREAIEKGINDPSISYQYSSTHYYLKDLKGAIEWMEKTVEEDPEDKVAQQWLDLMKNSHP